MKSNILCCSSRRDDSSSVIGLSTNDSRLGEAPLKDSAVAISEPEEVDVVLVLDASELSANLRTLRRE
jgi:hypothetical protein